MSPCFTSFWSMSLRLSLYLSARFLFHCDSPLSRVCGAQFCFLLLINKIMFICVLQVCPLCPDSVLFPPLCFFLVHMWHASFVFFVNSSNKAVFWFFTLSLESCIWVHLLVAHSHCMTQCYTQIEWIKWNNFLQTATLANTQKLFIQWRAKVFSHLSFLLMLLL